MYIHPILTGPAMGRVTDDKCARGLQGRTPHWQGNSGISEAILVGLKAEGSGSTWLHGNLGPGLWAVIGPVMGRCFTRCGMSQSRKSSC